MPTMPGTDASATVWWRAAWPAQWRNRRLSPASTASESRKPSTSV